MGISPQRGTAYQDWMNEPPYEIQSKEKFGDVKWMAGCHCGRVVYDINRGAPMDSKYCHCRLCQVLHGAPFQWAAIFHKSDIRFRNGTDGLSFYNSSTKERQHELPCKVSCANCHSLLMDEGRNVILLFPELIRYSGAGETGDDMRRKFSPSCHIFYDQRVMDIPDGKPKWSGINNDSEPIKD